jgi:hypothetical protein
MDLTYREAVVYLCAAMVFVGSIVGVCLHYGQAQVHLQGSESLLLLIPMSAAATIMWIAHSVAVRSLSGPDGPPFVLAWGLAGIWLMWGLAIPIALRRLRHLR